MNKQVAAQKSYWPFKPWQGNPRLVPPHRIRAINVFSSLLFLFVRSATARVLVIHISRHGRTLISLQIFWLHLIWNRSIFSTDFRCFCFGITNWRVREPGVSERGGTRHTHCVLGAAAAAFTFKRAAVLRVPILLPASENVSLSNPSMYILYNLLSSIYSYSHQSVDQL